MAKQSSRFSGGSNFILHKGRITKTTVGNRFQDDRVEKVDYSEGSRVGFVPAGFEHCPDLISNVFYGTPGLWWLLMVANNITDPFEGFNTNDRIIIPNIE